MFDLSNPWQLCLLLTLPLMALLLIELLKAPPRVPREQWPLLSIPLFTDEQRALFERLLVVFPMHFIFPHVPLRRLLSVLPVESADQWDQRLRGQRADFVICRRDYSILAVLNVERVNWQSDRARKDFRSQALEAAGIPALSVRADQIPSAAELGASMRQFH